MPVRLKRTLSGVSQRYIQTHFLVLYGVTSRTIPGEGIINIATTSEMPAYLCKDKEEFSPRMHV